MDKSSEAARLKTAIAQSPAGTIVFVPKKYARHFATPPSDGRTYVVEDPVRRNIWHWTFPDGSYEAHDELGRINAPPWAHVKMGKKRVWSPNKKRQKFRLVRMTSCKAVQGDGDLPPEISLIGLERVERITGC